MLEAITRAWRTLAQRRELRHCRGWARAVEIAASKRDPELENVHIHVAMAMSSAYSGRYYLNQARWRDLWQECIGDLYRNVQVGCRSILSACARTSSRPTRTI